MSKFVNRLTRVLSIDDERFRVGLMQFSTDSSTEFNLNDYLTNDGALTAARGVRQGVRGVRNTAEAIDYVRTDMFTAENGDRDWARNYIILLTGEQQR